MGDFCAIIPAAGIGSRMKSNEKKQFMEIGGRSLIYYSIKAFLDAGIKSIILAINEEDRERMEDTVQKYGLSNIRLVKGGATRAESVYAALKEAREEYCLIHDGARPFVDESIIRRCMEGAVKYEACIAAVRAKDTVKIAGDSKNVIDHTPDRNLVYLAQTPQAFRRELILGAYERASETGGISALTDDASALEREGHRVFLVEGSYRNIKVTEPSDLLLVESFIGKGTG